MSILQAYMGSMECIEFIQLSAYTVRSDQFKVNLLFHRFGGSISGKKIVRAGSVHNYYYSRLHRNHETTWKNLAFGEFYLAVCCGENGVYLSLQIPQRVAKSVWKTTFVNSNVIVG